MHKQNQIFAVLLIVVAGASHDAAALGFGTPPQAAVLGQALDLTIPLRLDPGESLAAECATAEVTVGEHRLAVDQVRARVVTGEGGAAAVRVATTAVVDEPVVSLTVSVGCPVRMTRRLVLLADPLPTDVSAPIAAPAEPFATPAASTIAEARPAPAAEVPASAPAPALAAAPAARVRSRTEHDTPRPPARKPLAPVRAAKPTAAAPVARLRLEAADAPPANTTKPEAVEAAASAAAAAAAASAAEAASAASTRIAALEDSITKLRAEAAADREALRLLRAQTQTDDVFTRMAPYLAGLASLLALVALWLWARVRALQRQRDLAWWKATALPEPAPSTNEPQAPATMAETAAGGDTATAAFSTTRPGLPGGMFTPAPEASPEPATQRTQPLPVGWREERAKSRDVSVEELIDLEQQAEFFIVLGQEDAAVDLLVEHLRNTGGGSPLPYLKLLEIYRRRGDREAYDRTRARFNHRFNAYAPDWDADVQHGRSLEDYPAVIARLQMAWPSPIDAMAELESLLFRKSRGELFDLPAYRDVLFLYSMARDLLDREPLESGNVDVLLPLVDEAERTQPLSAAAGAEGLPSGLGPLDDQPTVPVDLDLTQPQMPDSIFGDTTSPGRLRH